MHQYQRIILVIIPILSLIIFAVFLYFSISDNVRYSTKESMTNQEAGSILPVIYDSSLSSKTKITDLLGIPINDASYNQIINSQSKDTDSVINAVKKYIGSIVSFSNENGGAPSIPSTTQPINTSSTANTVSTTNATTTKPATLGISHKSYAERAAETSNKTTTS